MPINFLIWIYAHVTGAIFTGDINDNYKPDVSDDMVSVMTLEVVKKSGAMANSQILYLLCQ